MSYRAHVIRIIGLALMLSLTGCASWFGGQQQEPEVHLVKVQVVKARLLQQHFMLSFRIDNPNDSRLRVRGLVYRVTLGGILLADGEADNWFTVAPHGREFFDVPVRTNLWEHLRDVIKLLKHPDQPVPYLLEGRLKSGILFRHNQRLRHSGEIIPGDFIPEQLK
jgi:LEA14-like dessication related protein